MDRTFDIYYQVNDPDKFPEGVIRNVSLQNYVRIKHFNDFAYNFLRNYFQEKNFYHLKCIEKLWVSIDGVDFRLIFYLNHPDLHKESEYVQ